MTGAKKQEEEKMLFHNAKFVLMRAVLRKTTGESNVGGGFYS